MQDISEILKAHELWITSSEREGKRAELSGAQLRDADLTGANLRGVSLAGADLRNANLSAAELVHADLRDCQLQHANLSHANLLLADFTGADLAQANLTQTTSAEQELGHVRRGPRFKEANLEGADLSDAYCAQSDFSGANVNGTRWVNADLTQVDFHECQLQGLTFDNANLTRANLKHADMEDTSLRGAQLVQANLEGANLRRADIREALLHGANLGEAQVEEINYNRATRFRGARVATCYGSTVFRRFAQDQDFIEEFKANHPALYRLWWLLTDCGRSMMRVALWSLLFIFLFALSYFALGPTAFTVANVEGLGWNLFTTLYYSVVTFTTLGFGDITPNTQLAAILVILEVIVGYIMLGILISILANKVARRS